MLAYAEGINGAEQREAALALVRRLPQEAAVVPVQVLGELFNVLVRKGGKSRSDARDALLSWRDALPVVETSPEIMLAAADLARTINWTSGMRSSSRPPRGRAADLLLSEDLQEGFHLGRRDGGQSIRLAAARSAGRRYWRMTNDANSLLPRRP